MTQVRVVTDSAADLVPEMAAQMGITVVPLVVRFGSETYLDGQLTIDEFWQRVSEGQQPGTSQPSIGAFEQAYSRLIEAGHSVLCLTLTGKHSGTYSGACTAARQFGDRVRVLDSLSLSLGQGFQVLAAARAALAGLSLDEVAQLVERVRDRTQLYILLDTIEFIRRGGRASLLLPTLTRITKILKIKPILALPDGRLAVHSLARSYGRGLEQIRDEILRLRPIEGLAVIHARCLDLARQMASDLSQRLGFPRDKIVFAETGPLLSTHSGPGVIGVAAVQQAGGESV